jgi:hypothetical protein
VLTRRQNTKELNSLIVKLIRTVIDNDYVDSSALTVCAMSIFDIFRDKDRHADFDLLSQITTERGDKVYTFPPILAKRPDITPEDVLTSTEMLGIAQQRH